MYTRGYPSEFISYTLENICVKFHAFIRSVTKISLRDWTILDSHLCSEPLRGNLKSTGGNPRELGTRLVLV